MTNSLHINESLWKKCFFAISIFILILLPTLSKDYGQSGDEWLEIEYGKDIYNYFFNGDKQALSYANKSMQYQGMELYGGLFDFYTEVLHRWFPSADLLRLKNFCNSIVGAILMIFTGLLARRLSKKWSVGLLALLFMFLSPRIFGESMNNPKDIPHACGFVIGIYGLVALLEDLPKKIWRNALILALGFGMTFGSRPAGGLLQACYFVLFIGLYFFLNKDFKTRAKADGNKLFKRLLLFTAGALVVGFLIGLSAWPFGLQDPITNSLESLKGMANRDIQIRVLFDGTYRFNNHMPWYYEFKWICIANPVVILAGVGLFLSGIFLAFKQYGRFPVILLVFASFFPLWYMVYKHSSVHDTWRHVFFVYVYWVIMAALGWDLLGSFIKKASLKWLPLGIAFAGLIPAMIWTVRSHPNQYVYFNELQGGVKGAFGYYDLDYYQNTNKQAADWILKNAKPVKGRKIMVMSNMVGFDKFFYKDTAWLEIGYSAYPKRFFKEWDYYVNYPRYISVEQMQNGRWPPQNVVHTIAVDGVPLSVILDRKSRAGIEAYDAQEKKDFVSAAQKYAEFIKTDTSDQMAYIDYAICLAQTAHIDEAIAAANKAIAIDPSMPEFFNLLYNFYLFKGDNANADKAMSEKQALETREHELMEE